MGLGTQKQSQTQQTSNTTNSSPWSVQTPYIQQGFDAARNALSTASGAPAPTQFTSQFTPQQLAAFQQQVDTGLDPSVANRTEDVGNSLGVVGVNGAGTGLYGLSRFTPTSMSSILSDANAAANDPSVQGRIDAALRDARRSVSEDVLPQIGRNAALSGNTNSSRTGVAEGIVQRGLADTTADTSANIRGAAYDQGLQTALTRAMTGDSNSLGALQALTNGGISAANSGVGANSASVQQRSGLFDIANQGITGQQAGSNAAIQDALQRWQFGTDSPFQALNNYWNIVGGNSWGGTSSSNGTQTTQGESTASPAAQIGALLGASGSAFGRNGLNFFK